jgi:hypothetical protein
VTIQTIDVSVRAYIKGDPGTSTGTIFTYIFESVLEKDIMISEIGFSPIGCFFYKPDGDNVSVMYQILTDRIKITSTVNLLNHIIKII